MTVALAALCITACNDGGVGQTLPTPTELAVDSKGIVTWQPVEGAASYELRVNNVIFPSSETQFYLSEIPEIPSDKQFTVRVRAVNGGASSEWSELLTYTPKTLVLATPKLTAKDGVLSWTAVANASKTVVTFNGDKTELSAETLQFDLKTLKTDSVVGVQFIGDGLSIADSGVAEVIYNAALKTCSLTVPQNVHMNGYELTFEAVYGANTYYLLDVNDKITAITKNRCDLTNQYLVKAVWAGDSRGYFEDSERAGIKYYAEGAGTEQDPFMISSPEELRFVDYYEGINEAKYYKFNNDVALPSYVPDDEEVYNNFYSFGSLSGVIDGDGHKLSNAVKYFCDGYSSMFDSIAPSGVIKNLVIDNANFRTWTNLSNDGIMHEKGGECALLAYTNRGTIDNVTVIDSYICAVKDGAAALVSINKGTVSNCNIESSTTVYGANEAGGIAIFNSGTIEGCINRADISGETTVGGIVGRNNGIVTKCGNEAKITANTYGGGIVGYNFNIFDEKLLFDSTISQCYNYGEISVVSYGGGIAGKNGGDGINEVGKVSYANAGIISCYNTGAIIGSESLGGIVGDNYGYYEAGTDLGVVNCYNSGAINVDVRALRSTRIFLSFENCNWDPTMDGALFYVYYWGAAGGPSWPGVRMTATEINGMTYYYADMSIKAEQLTGVIFNRCNPANLNDESWGKTKDIIGRMTPGNLLFKINSGWTTADKSDSKNLIESMTLSAGGIAGYSNMINDCYYLTATVAGKPLAAGAAKGEQNNIIYIGGTEVQSSACQISASALTTFASTLNAYADVWQNGANGPVLKWQGEN